MARFVLRPCRIREDKVVPLRDVVPEELDWGGLVKKFVPGRRPEGMRTLSLLERNSYVGLIRHRSGEIRCFFLLNPDRSGQIGWLLRQDVSLPGRVETIYRVEVAEHDRVFQEIR